LPGSTSALMMFPAPPPFCDMEDAQAISVIYIYYTDIYIMLFI
jgi:hypothetical protein